MDRGSTAGLLGAEMCHLATSATSTRVTASFVPSGLHQYPLVRRISSAATNSALPQLTVDLSPMSNWRPASDPSAGATCKFCPSTNATDAPSGDMRGSKAPVDPSTTETVPAEVSQSMSSPARLKATREPSAFTEYEVIPPALSRRRSRRARSASGNCSMPSPPSRRGSATSLSCDVSKSSFHNRFTGSSGPALRRNNTDEPSEVMAKLRGAPRVNRCVRAF